MAVINGYVDPKLNTSTTQNTSRLSQGVQGEGAEKRRIIATWAIPTTDSDGSIYRLITLPSTAIIHSILIANDAMAGFTSFGIGLYLPNLPQLGLNGAAISAALFVAAGTLATARNSLTPGVALEGMSALNPQALNATSGVSNCVSKLFELAGETVNGNSRYAQFDLCVTATTRGAAAGRVAIGIDYTCA